MATVTANAAQAGVQPKGLRVGLVAVTGFYSFPTSTSVGTTIQMVKVPAGATPVLIRVANTSVGDNTIQVGDGNDADRYAAEATLAAGLVVCTLPADPYTYTVDDTIDLLISRASATTLGGAVYLTCIFSMNIQAV